MGELDYYGLPDEYETFAEYTENMVGMEFTRKRRRELLSCLAHIEEGED